MKAAVINLILNRLQQIMIPNWVITRIRRRPTYQQHPGLPLDIIRVAGIRIQPLGSLGVPIRDLGSESEGDIRIKRWSVIRVGFAAVGSDLGNYSSGLFLELLALSVGLRREIKTNSSPKNKDSDEATKDGDFDVVDGLGDLAATGAAATPAGGDCGRGKGGAGGGPLLGLPHRRNLGILGELGELGS